MPAVKASIENRLPKHQNAFVRPRHLPLSPVACVAFCACGGAALVGGPMAIDSPPLPERMEIDDPWSPTLVLLDLNWSNNTEGLVNAPRCPAQTGAVRDLRRRDGGAYSPISTRRQDGGGPASSTKTSQYLVVPRQCLLFLLCFCCFFFCVSVLCPFCGFSAKKASLHDIPSIPSRYPKVKIAAFNAVMFFQTGRSRIGAVTRMCAVLVFSFYLQGSVALFPRFSCSTSCLQGLSVESALHRLACILGAAVLVRITDIIDTPSLSLFGASAAGSRAGMYQLTCVIDMVFTNVQCTRKKWYLPAADGILTFYRNLRKFKERQDGLAGVAVLFFGCRAVDWLCAHSGALRLYTASKVVVYNSKFLRYPDRMIPMEERTNTIDIKKTVQGSKHQRTSMKICSKAFIKQYKPQATTAETNPSNRLVSSKANT
ncbi:hypothetical protein BGW37DRAFT_519790 [Umbelopsis sp. PMI_123]|nr:hypothetical protein BGW37DRAFT_519790 [Umbelopsis sp. PMI_123]